MGIPASGQMIRVEGMNFYRLKDGRVTDIWTQSPCLALVSIYVPSTNARDSEPLSNIRSLCAS